jgi:predicted amidohydrolase
MQGETVLWMQSLKSQNAAITGSVVIKESDNYYNHLSFPSGEIQHYDKRHLFTLAGEDKVYTKEPKSSLLII